jgi:opacity protein-like surface antigen
MRKILLSSLLLLSVLNAEESTSKMVTTDSNESKASKKVEIIPTSSRKSGFYAGVGMGLINFGGEVVVDDGYNEYTYDVDTEDKPMMLKIGYITSNENRIEVYFKSDSIEAEENGNNINMYDTSTFGMNYQWGISSLSTEKILPYIRVGLGFGSADLEDTSVDVDAIDFDLGAGIYYDVTSNIDVMTGIYRRAVAISSDQSSTTIISTVNGLEFAVNYHF